MGITSRNLSNVRRLYYIIILNSVKNALRCGMLLVTQNMKGMKHVYIELRWTDATEEHIFVKHHVSISEVEEVVYGKRPLKLRRRDERYVFVGPTEAGRILSIILAYRQGYYYIITAMDSNDTDRMAYRRWVGN